MSRYYCDEGERYKDEKSKMVEGASARDRRYIVVLIYDIVENRRRSQMVKCLEGYGVRVQKSAFEALLTEEQSERMVRKASRIINESSDSLRVYVLAKHTSVRSWGIGHAHVEDVILF